MSKNRVFDATPHASRARDSDMKMIVVRLDMSRLHHQLARAADDFCGNAMLSRVLEHTRAERTGDEDARDFRVRASHQGFDDRPIRRIVEMGAGPRDRLAVSPIAHHRLGLEQPPAQVGCEKRDIDIAP